MQCNYTCLPDKLLHLSLGSWQGLKWVPGRRHLHAITASVPSNSEEVLLASMTGLCQPLSSVSHSRCPSPEPPQLINAVSEKNGPGGQISLSESGLWHQLIHSPVTWKCKAMPRFLWQSLTLSPAYRGEFGLSWAGAWSSSISRFTFTLRAGVVCPCIWDF